MMGWEGHKKKPTCYTIAPRGKLGNLVRNDFMNMSMKVWYLIFSDWCFLSRSLRVCPCMNGADKEGKHVST